MRGVSDTTAIAGADPWRQGATHMRELAGWITLPRRAGARWCARSFVASPDLSVVGLAAHYDEVISGRMAREPEVPVTDARMRHSDQPLSSPLPT